MFVDPIALGATLGTIGGAVFLGAFFAIRFWRNLPLCDALDGLGDRIAQHAPDLLTDYAKAVAQLNVNDRESGIVTLIEAATIRSSPVAFLALRDHIEAKDLKNALGRGDLRPWVQSDTTVGLKHAQKLVLFAIGKRSLKDLDAELTDDDKQHFAEYIHRMNTPVLLRNV